MFFCVYFNMFFYGSLSHFFGFFYLFYGQIAQNKRNTRMCVGVIKKKI